MSLPIGPDNAIIRKVSVLNLLGRVMSQHSLRRTKLINLPAELRWFSKNLPLGPWPSGLGPWARFLLTQPRSAGRFIPNHNIVEMT